ncbi:MAG: hypothetical protein AMXMBFR20_03100 [Planctomycetia bacterium]|nr:hypothetical protein [Planctomycetota bacterium]OQZ06414.1 MAG: hypothetical protein B6D36_05125 [Planctomycetes bacterium UTPLA1]
MNSMKRFRRHDKPGRHYPTRPDAHERKTSRAAEVLHVDEHLIIVAKPPRVSLDIAWDDEPTILDQLTTLGHASADDTLLPVYMMDPLLSGVAVLARDEQLFATLRPQFVSGTASITCDVLVRGRVSEREGAIENRIRPKRSGNGMLCVDDTDGAEAKTAWALKDSFVGMAYLECRPRPADPNVARVHLQHIGLPLIVDGSYGGGTELRLSSFKAGYRPSPRHPERPLLDRVSLHVSGISFAHPVTGASLSYQVEAPKDFRAALHQLERHGRIPR